MTIGLFTNKRGWGQRGLLYSSLPQFPNYPLPFGVIRGTKSNDTSSDVQFCQRYETGRSREAALNKRKKIQEKMRLGSWRRENASMRERMSQREE